MSVINVKYLTKDNNCSPLESDQTGTCSFNIYTGVDYLKNQKTFHQKLACTKNQQFNVEIKQPDKETIEKIITCPSSLDDSANNIEITADFKESDDSFQKRIAIQEGGNFFMNQIYYSQQNQNQTANLLSL